jgi:hypothetical protein
MPRFLVTSSASPPSSTPPLPPRKRRGRDERSSLLGVGGGGASANSLREEHADRPPTPDPSPPRASARGGRGVDHTCPRILAACFCARVSFISRPLQSEGAGKAGCTLHPRSRVQNCAKKHAHEHTGPAEAIRLSLRNGFNAYFRALPGDRACLTPSPRGLRFCSPGWACKTSARLDANR